MTLPQRTRSVVCKVAAEYARGMDWFGEETKLSRLITHRDNPNLFCVVFISEGSEYGLVVDNHYGIVSEELDPAEVADCGINFGEVYSA